MRQRATKAILAISPNVVPLPTAAPRMVDNHRFAAQRKAGRQAKDASPFKARYIDPQVRAKMPDAAALLMVERSPELLLAIAIFEALDEPQKRQVRGQCQLLKTTGAAARGAAVMTEVRTIGESLALDAAMAKVREIAEDS